MLRRFSPRLTNYLPEVVNRQGRGEWHDMVLESGLLVCGGILGQRWGSE